MKKFLFIISFICFLGYSSALASPMFAPTKEQAFKSPFIVIAEYRGYNLDGKIEYFNGPVARYKIIRLLKGANLPAVLNVRYEFHDGSACIEERGWKFKEDLMPKEGSRWILFLKKDERTKYWSTYRGNFGRWDANSENTQEVESALKEGQGN